MSRADKRARRLAEHLEWIKAQGRNEAEDLGPSTTDTTFLYSGGPRPTETMQMVGEVVAATIRCPPGPTPGHRLRAVGRAAALAAGDHAEAAVGQGENACV